jgi:hypothetical protein
MVVANSDDEVLVRVHAGSGARTYDLHGRRAIADTTLDAVALSGAAVARVYWTVFEPASFIHDYVGHQSGTSTGGAKLGAKPGGVTCSSYDREVRIDRVAKFGHAEESKDEKRRQKAELDEALTSFSVAAPSGTSTRMGRNY